jgi:hypothetical protein
MGEEKYRSTFCMIPFRLSEEGREKKPIKHYDPNMLVYPVKKKFKNQLFQGG